MKRNWFESKFRGGTAFVAGVALLIFLNLAYDGGMQWGLKLIHSASEALVGLTILYWGIRSLVMERVHELEGTERRQRELALIIAAGIVVAGALAG